MDAVLDLFEKYRIRVIGRIWVKEPGIKINGRSTYTSSVQDIARKLNGYCRQKRSRGMILCDSRTQALDVQVAHSLFTMQHRARGNQTPFLEGIPVFGHSQNEVGLQLADFVCSALLFPIASRVLIPHGYTSKHAHSRFDELHKRYGKRLEGLQFNHENSSKTQYGIVVSDRYAGKSAQYLWRQPKSRK